MLLRAPTLKRGSGEEEEIDIMELLKNVDPKEYEKYARMYGITDFRGLLQAFELLKQSQEEETHRLVCSFADSIIFRNSYLKPLTYALWISRIL